MTPTRDGLLSDLVTLYGSEPGEQACQAILDRIEQYRGDRRAASALDEKDVFLITYGDQFRDSSDPGGKPLRTLEQFCRKWLKGCINTVHILPFYPYSSDDGFSVLDYHQVDPNLGDWEDIHRFRRSNQLMFDLVINHISAGSAWFQAFLEGKAPYRDFFITPPEDADMRTVIRPRTSPLLTTFQTAQGKQKVWTTFSADQVDLNYKNPEVLLAAVDVLLDYASRGASYLRLDAVAFLWKESGTECLNLPQTHRLIQIFRKVLDLAAPHIRLITETNIPHRQNISYFGDGQNEAQLVYNFALPPLVLHALINGQVDRLREWASTLATPSDEAHFFNFLASHDGIGINPARGILAEEEIDRLVETVKQRGGLISYKTMPDGSAHPYELNINYLDALTDYGHDESPQIRARRFLVSQAVLLALKGVPGIYIHSLLGSRGWKEGPALAGQNRAINRQKFELSRLESELADPASLRYLVFHGYERMLKARRSHEAFSPGADQTILPTGSSVFTLLRKTHGGSVVLCCHNFTGQTLQTDLPQEARPFFEKGGVDLIEGWKVDFNDLNISLQPYQVLWAAAAASG